MRKVIVIVVIQIVFASQANAKGAVASQEIKGQISMEKLIDKLVDRVLMERSPCHTDLDYTTLAKIYLDKSPIEARETIHGDAVPHAPIINQLKEIDDEHLALEKDFDLTVQRLELEKLEKQALLLNKRTEVLSKAQTNVEATPATPACHGFWLQALKNFPEIEEYIEDHDEPVLEFLKDIRFKLAADGKEVNHDFTLVFEFAANPYFDQKELSKTYHTKEENPYLQQIEVTKIEATQIAWKDGEDITVGNQRMRTEPRRSFFNFFFQNLEENDEIPDTLQCYLDAKDFPNGMPMPDISEFMGQDHGIAERITSCLIPFATRWYTGEACPVSDSDSDDEDSEEQDSHDSDEASSGPNTEPAAEKVAEAKENLSSEPSRTLGDLGDPASKPDGKVFKNERDEETRQKNNPTATSEPRKNKVTCTTCNAEFEDVELRPHCKSSWHLYNIKRKTKGLDPVTVEKFQNLIQALNERKERERAAQIRN